MKYLLDTHALLWWLFGDAHLSPLARDLIADRANEIFASSASAWEIGTKWRLGRLPAAGVLVQDMEAWLEKAGISELPVTVAHAQRAGTWVQAHRDPFDRMLAAQSAIEALPILSNDPALQGFGVAVLW